MKLIKSAEPTYSKTGKQKSMAYFKCPACLNLVVRQSSSGRVQDTCGCGTPKSEPKTTTLKCLKCDKPFKSVNKKSNRFCARCNRVNDEGYHKEAHGGGGRHEL